MIENSVATDDLAGQRGMMRYPRTARYGDEAIFGSIDGEVWFRRALVLSRIENKNMDGPMR